LHTDIHLPQNISLSTTCYKLLSNPIRKEAISAEDRHQGPRSRLIVFPIHDPSVPSLLLRLLYTVLQELRLHVPVRCSVTIERFANDQLVQRDTSYLVSLEYRSMRVLVTRVEQKVFAGMVLIDPLIIVLDLWSENHLVS
jgi:hypothetical protein